MIDLLIDALATARLTVLTSADVVLEDPREAIVQWAIETEHRKVRYFATCPFCQSPYWAVAVLAARHFAPKQWDWVARGLAFSMVASYIAKQVEH
jgi:hypothetical protein